MPRIAKAGRQFPNRNNDAAKRTRGLGRTSALPITLAPPEAPGVEPSPMRTLGVGGPRPPHEEGTKKPRLGNRLGFSPALLLGAQAGAPALCVELDDLSDRCAVNCCRNAQTVRRGSQSHSLESLSLLVCNITALCQPAFLCPLPAKS